MLQLQNVLKSFVQPDRTPLPVLDIPLFEVAEGEQLVLVGRSGCGKTTLLHVIAGISRPDAGRVKIDGWDIALMPEAECDQFRAERIGYVFQTFNLLPGFTALENVLLGMTFAKGREDPAGARKGRNPWTAFLATIGRRHADRVRARELLHRVGLDHRMTHKPTMLSVGEQQRVAVARALANRPKVLLADEPTANVDGANQQQVIDLLRETCREQDAALVLVTHSPEVASQFDRVERLEQLNRAWTNR